MRPLSGFMPPTGYQRASDSTTGDPDASPLPAGCAADSSKRRYGVFREGYRRGPAQASADASARSSWGGWRYVGEYYRLVGRQTGALALVFSLAGLAALLGLVLPYATKWVIDGVLLNPALAQAEQHRLLAWFAGTMVALMLVQQGIEAYRGYRMTVVNARVIFRLRQKLFDHLLNLPLHKLQEMKGGGIVSRVSGDVDEISGLLQMGIITPGVAVLRVVFTVAVLLYISWKMALVALVLIPPIILLNVVWLKRVRPIYRAMREARSEIDGRVVETFAGIRVVRAFRREQRESRNYAVQHHTVIRQRVLSNLLQLIITSGWGLLIPGVSLLIVWYGGTRYLAAELQIGAILAFQMYAFMLLHPVSQIVQSYSAVQRALAAMERTFEVLHEPADKPDRPTAIEAPRPLESIEFENVSFEYVEGHPVIRDFSLRVRGGQTVALVGASGSGKTTVTNLVARFIDPAGGRIRLNGVDLRDIRLRSLRNMLGVVEQDVFLFDGTVSENIAYGARHATPQMVTEAAIRANAHDFIQRLPRGYHTLIGERGVRLSGGERQRVSIARALLADPQILILDEATSSLDTEAEQLIQQSLATLFAQRTTFVIAHRLSTVTQADAIVVMQEGRIAEVGTHRSLIDSGGQYAEMVARQMRAHTDAVNTLDW
ncbi:MAG: ABC transporter ATP-binding protein [bacterium]|nr:ABC transporter ATP-binding protein [bacterium]